MSTTSMSTFQTGPMPVSSPPMIPNPTSPEISVVIPTKDRRARLEQTLLSLGRQTLSMERMEVIVVADGCTDGTPAQLERNRYPYRLQVIDQPAQGPATARNRGAHAARGRLLLFLDDDVEASQGLVAAHLRAHEVTSRRAAIGYLPPLLTEQKGFLKSALHRWWESMFERMRDPEHRYAYTDVLSGNVSLPAALFREVGGFDPAFDVHEDYELGYRLLQAGADLTFVPEAWGYHHEKTGLSRALLRKRREGHADILLGERHPELITELPYYRNYEAGGRFYRLLVRMTARFGPLGDACAALLEKGLAFYEWTGRRGEWEQLLDYLLLYWYWRGILEKAGSWGRFRGLIDNPGDSPPSSPVDPSCRLRVDLAEGLAKAEDRVDERRPESLEIWLGRCFIGVLPSIPGAEPLRGIHLRAALDREFSWALLNAFGITHPLVPLLAGRLAADVPATDGLMESQMAEGPTREGRWKG